MMPRSLRHAVPAILLLVGCGKAAAPSLLNHDAGYKPPTDSGPGDAGPTDAGPMDAGGSDAGPVDAGPPDSGPDGGFPCTTHAQCPTGLVCIAGECGLAGSVPQGGPCTASRDCQANLYCALPPDVTPPQTICLPAGTVAADGGCTTDGDCQAGLRCNYLGFGGVCSSGGTADYGDSCTSQLSCLDGLFCGGTGGSQVCESYGAAFPPFAGVACEDDGPPTKVYFQAPRPGAYPKDFFRLPYPNDIRVTVNGSSRSLDISDFPTPGPTILGPDIVALYRDALEADFAGFSTIAPVTFRFNGPVELGSITAKVVDLTAADRLFFYVFDYALDGTAYNCSNRLTVYPAESTQFEAGHTYAVLSPAGIKGADGGFVVPDADFESLVSNTAPSDTTLTSAWNAYAPLRAWFNDPNNGQLSSNWISAAVFTVANPLTTMTAVAAAVAPLPPPALSDSRALRRQRPPLYLRCAGRKSRLRALNAAFWEIHGRMSLPIFQGGTEPYLTPDAGGGIVLDANGNAVVQRNEAVCFALTIPKSTAPAAGWPLVITHHGTGGSMTDFIGSGVSLALAQATSPMAVLGFDAVEHWERANGSTESPEYLVFNILNPRAARDNFLQGASDILNEAKFAKGTVTISGGPASPIAFNPSQVSFFGHSQGSTSGELAMPFLDGVPAAVLSGAGAHLTESLVNKTDPIPSKVGIAALIQDTPGNIDDQHPVLGLFQNFFDRSDPLASDPYIVNNPIAPHAPHSVFMTWGTGDTYTPSETLRANTFGLGIPSSGTLLEDANSDGSSPFQSVSRPVTDNITVGGVGVTGVMVQYATPAGDDGHFVAFDVAQAQSDWTSFLQGSLTGAPTLP